MDASKYIAGRGELETLIDCTRRRLAWALVARQVVFWLTGFVFACGLGVVILRQTLGVDRVLLVWCLAGVLPAVVIGVCVGLRGIPSRDTIRTMLDQRNQCGGLLMARSETETGSWSQRLGTLRGLRVQWRCGRAMLAMVVGLAFLTGAFAIPDHLVAAPSVGLDITEPVDELNAQIELLEIENILEEPEARELHDRLDDVSEQARGQDPAKTWEALDHVTELVAREADDAAEDALRMSQQLQEARTLSEAMAQPGDALSPEMRQEAMAELSEQLEALAEMAAQVPPGALDSEALEQLAQEAREMGLSPEQAEALAEMLAQQQGDLTEMMQKLAEAGMVDPAQLGQAMQFDKVDAEGLLEFLAAQDGDAGEDLDAALRMFCAGRGGTDQGGGLTDLTWRDPASEDGAGYAPELLPPASLESMLQSQSMGASQRDPEADGEAQASTGNALTHAQAGPGGGGSQPVLPRHRRAVREFFDRGPAPDNTPPTEAPEE
ncbi:MAG: hypothetical protein ACIAXF_14855 [Phycisphaerales bacterium JB063]